MTFKMTEVAWFHANWVQTYKQHPETLSLLKYKIRTIGWDLEDANNVVTVAHPQWGRKVAYVDNDSIGEPGILKMKTEYVAADDVAKRSVGYQMNKLFEQLGFAKAELKTMKYLVRKVLSTHMYFNMYFLCWVALWDTVTNLWLIQPPSSEGISIEVADVTSIQKKHMLQYGHHLFRTSYNEWSNSHISYYPDLPIVEAFVPTAPELHADPLREAEEEVLSENEEERIDHSLLCDEECFCKEEEEHLANIELKEEIDCMGAPIRESKSTIHISELFVGESQIN